MPSCVGIDLNGELIVGRKAKNQMIAAPDDTIVSIKRLMGTAYTMKLGDREFTPEEISGFILRELKKRAEEHLKRPVKKAVITVPAQFDDLQRQATKNAGELAGLEVVRIINEPTAATLAYEAGNEGDRRMLVYDLGGGTFDGSVVVTEQGVIEVKASSGDTHLGGDDFDELLMKNVEERFEKENGRPMTNDLQAKRRLRVAVEQAKCRLSDEPVTHIREEYIDGDLHIDMEIERSDYEELIQDYLLKTLDCVGKTLSDAKLLPSDIDQIMLVGGSTRTPAVQIMLKQAMKKEAHAELNPDLVVAMGAAVQAATIGGIESKKILVDITPHTFGTSALSDGYFAMEETFVPVIHRNTPLPVTKSEIFFTTHDNQKEVLVKIFQGENKDPYENLFLGEFLVSGLSKAPSGNPIILTLALNLSGMLEVTAREKLTNLSKSITIDTKGQHSKLDMEKALANMAALFDEDEDTDFDDLEIIDSDDDDVIAFPQDEADEGNTSAVEITAADLKKRTEALLSLEIDEDDKKELRDLIAESDAKLAEKDWDALSDCNDRLSDLLFYLED